MPVEKMFNQFKEWPIPNTRVTVPRITETEARTLAAGKRLIEERGTTMPNYDVRQYLDVETGETVYLAGDFSGWN